MISLLDQNVKHCPCGGTRQHLCAALSGILAANRERNSANDSEQAGLEQSSSAGANACGYMLPVAVTLHAVEVCHATGWDNGQVSALSSCVPFCPL